MVSDNEIMVSVVMLAYNHEKYIEQAILSVIAQKTNFRFELIVHDDASPDNTANVIEELSSRYPEIIIPILQQSNQCSKGTGIHKSFIVPNIRGKYVAYCEGDDYWLDENKLQKQVDALESNPNCSMSVNRVKVSYLDSSLDHVSYCYNTENGIITSEEFFQLLNKCGYPFQTSGYFVRTELYKQYHLNKPFFAKCADVGDEPLMLYMGLHGDIFYFADIMSCYRKNVPTSWSATVGNTCTKRAEHYKKMVRMCEEFENYCCHKYSLHGKIVTEQHHVAVLEGNYKKAFKLMKANPQLYRKKRILSYFIRAYFPTAHMILRRIAGVS